MQYAIIATGGKQYIVKPGTVYTFEKLPGESGSVVSFDRVLCTFGEGSEVHVGTPTVAGARVTGTITAQGRSRKIIVRKYKAKSRYRRKHGHRQHFTKVRIDAIA